jgi:hypothetical protein
MSGILAMVPQVISASSPLFSADKKRRRTSGIPPGWSARSKSRSAFSSHLPIVYKFVMLS